MLRAQVGEMDEIALCALMQSSNLNEIGICRMKFRDKMFHDIWGALQIAAED